MSTPGDNIDGKGKEEAPESERDDSFIGKTIDGKYEILSKLGDGGMGAVYRAEHKLMGRTVAFKVLRRELAQDVEDDEFLQRFHSEAKTTSKINHPNAITVYDFGIEKEVPYIVMEYHDGRSLKDILSETGPLPLDRALNLVSQSCAALDEAHAHGIVHRDLKPDNIMISKHRDGSDRAVVLDFGIAKMLDTAGGLDVQMTQTGRINGTPRYMSPEQITRAENIDGRSDIYSLGIIIYEMLSGDVPFKADSALQLMAMQVQEQPVPLREFKPDLKIPAAVEAVVQKALEKDPDNRQQTVEELAEEFENAVADKSLRTIGNTLIDAVLDKPIRAATTSFSAVREKPKHSQFVVGGVGLGLIALVALGAYLMTGSEDVQLAEVDEVEESINVEASEEPAQELANAAREDVETEQQLAQDAADPKDLQVAQLDSAEPTVTGAQVAALFDEVFYLNGGMSVEPAVEVMTVGLAADEHSTIANKEATDEPVAPEVSALALFEQGTALTKEEKFTEAIAAFEQALTLKPDYTEAHKGLGVAYMKLGEQENAASSFTKALELDASDAKTHAALGVTYQKLDRFEDALTSFTQAAKLDAKYAPMRDKTQAKLAAKDKPATDENDETLKRAKYDDPSTDDIESLVMQLGSEQQGIRVKASKALETKGNAAVAPLVNALKNKNQKMRYWSAGVLGRIRAKAAVKPLISVLNNDASPLVRESATRALERIGTPEAMAATKAIREKERARKWEVYRERQKLMGKDKKKKSFFGSFSKDD